MPCRRPDEIVEGATVDLRRYFTNLLSSLARNRCPACREIRVQLRVKSLSSLPRNPCPAWCEIRTLVQSTLELDPFSGHVFAFRGRRGDIIKILWWSGDGMNLYAKRLERGRFIWPQAES